MPRRLTLAVAPLLLALALVGCTESTRLPPPEPPAAGEPLFASDEEALAAATAAYEEYLEVSNAVLRDGGANPERLSDYLAPEVFKSELEGFNLFLENGWRATGSTTLSSIAVQQVINGPGDQAEVVVYVCTDVGGNDVIDEGGVSQVDPNRPTIVAHEVVLLFTSISEVVLEEKTLWDPLVACPN